MLDLLETNLTCVFVNNFVSFALITAIKNRICSRNREITKCADLQGIAAHIKNLAEESFSVWELVQ